LFSSNNSASTKESPLLNEETKEYQNYQEEEIKSSANSSIKNTKIFGNFTPFDLSHLNLEALQTPSTPF